MSRPLDETTIIELAGIGPVPFAGMVLAGMGARVILVDRPDAPSMPDVMSSAVNRGKRSIVIDLKHQEGRATLLRLVAGADVLLEGLRPGVVERLGVGPDECRAANPSLVYGRMTGWGRSGPYAGMAGHDINYIGLVGALGAIGSEEQPIPPLNLVGDYGGGAMFLVAGILAGLVDRGRSGGRVVDAAMVDGAASLMSPIYAMAASGAWSPGRWANLLDGGAPFYTTYVTSDGGWMAVGALESQFYAALLDGLGLADADLPDRHDRDRWPELRRRLAERFAGRTRTEWEAVFAGTDACVTPVLEMTEAMRFPANRDRGVFTADGFPSPAPRMDDPAPDGLTAAPLPGAHTDEVLAEAGFIAAEIAGLREEGAIA